MRRGDLYRVYRGLRHDPKRSRVFVVVSRQVLIDSRYSTVVCAPIYSSYDGLSSQVRVGTVEGLNGKAKLTIRKARGIRSYEALETALYHALGHLPEPDYAHRFC